MSRAASAGHLAVVVAVTLVAIGCASQPTATVGVDPPADSVNAESPASTLADTQEAGSPAELTEAELDDLERTLDEMDKMINELEQDLADD